MNNLEIITKTLQKDKRLWSDDKEPQLLKAELISLVSQDDEKLVDLLVSENKIKDQFFKQVGKTMIFKKEKFLQLVTMNEFLPNSFTAFENKIGLQVNGSLLSKSDSVSLVFPHKDCVLEGGQTKEESKRNEMFFNTILAPDEVDRLKEPKVFTNALRISKDGEKKVVKISDKDNLIIKGNNLLALYSLLPKYRDAVKLIYIDPPYNTGSDSFGYNDNFNHSSWLTFMKNRLSVGHELLKDDGFIFTHCDKNEHAPLKLLLDEIFGEENYIDTITVVNNPRGRDYGGVANMHEYIHIYSKTLSAELNPLNNPNKEFPYEDSIGPFETRELRNRNTKFNEDNRPNLVYPFYLNPENEDKDGFLEISLESKKGWVKVMPAKSQGIQTVWRWGKEKSLGELNVNICGKAMKECGRYQIVEKYRKDTTMARSVWWDKEVNSEKGTLHLKELFNGKVFDHPKPEGTISRIIEMATNPQDLVLDYHLGSGTTATVAHKTNRQYIGIEQMDYIKPVTVERLKKVINGEKGGISKIVDWKGGGDFVYIEMLEWNQKYIDLLEKVKSKKDILLVKEKIEKEAFYKYQINFDDFDQKEFDLLSLEDQKQVLCDVLDLNHLYVNLGSIEDTTFKVSDADKKFNEMFYNKK